MPKPPYRPEEHICVVCGGLASQGVGVFTERGNPGRWYCYPHLPKTELPPVPAPVPRADAGATRPSRPGEQGKLL